VLDAGSLLMIVSIGERLRPQPIDRLTFEVASAKAAKSSAGRFAMGGYLGMGEPVSYGNAQNLCFGVCGIMHRGMPGSPVFLARVCWMGLAGSPGFGGGRHTAAFGEGCRRSASHCLPLRHSAPDLLFEQVHPRVAVVLAEPVLDAGGADQPVYGEFLSQAAIGVSYKPRQCGRQRYESRPIGDAPSPVAGSGKRPSSPACVRYPL